MNKDITIIYVIYKSGEIFFENIKRLKNFKKIVIDNDPNSILKDKIIEIDSTVDYTKLDKNIGMSKAANLAFNKVKTDFFLYLTADTIIDDKNINNLLQIFFKYNSVGLSCPIHLSLDNSYSGNYSCHPIFRFLKRNKLQSKIFEDVDLCDRIKKAKFEIIETPSSFCYHHKGASNITSFKNLYVTTSSFKFSEIYYFSKYGYKYTFRIFLHSFDYFFRIFLNIFLFNKNKIFVNIFRLIGVIRFLFYKKKTKF